MSGVSEHKSLDPGDDDNSTIQSVRSAHQPIEPCHYIKEYNNWLQKTFSYLVRKPEWHLVENILKIKTTLQLHKYATYTPLQWQQDLGHHLYDRYLNFLIEFFIILKATHRQFGLIPWDDYKIVRTHTYQRTCDKFTQVQIAAIDRDKSDFVSPALLEIPKAFQDQCLVSQKRSLPPGTQPAA